MLRIYILSEILKKGGILFLTVPYGQHAVLSSHRVYSQTDIKGVIPENLRVKEEFYYKKASDTIWGQVGKSDVVSVDSRRTSGAVACLMLEKI